MSVKECLGLNSYTFGYTANGVTLEDMGIVWKPGVRRLVLTNLLTTHIYVTEDGSGPTVANSYRLSAGVAPGVAPSLIVCGTKALFQRLRFLTGVGETGRMNVQQDNNLTTVV